MSSVVRSVVRSPLRGVVRGVVRGSNRNAVSVLRAKLLSSAIVRGIGKFEPPPIGDVDGNRLGKNDRHWYEALAEEARTDGQRRVYNQIDFSEDMQAGSFTDGINGSTIDNATQASFDGTANGQIFYSAIANPTTAGQTFIVSVYISLDSGIISSDSDFQLGFTGSSVTLDQADIGSEITDSQQRFTFSITTTGAGNLVPKIICNDAITITATKWQVEESTGRDA